MLVFAAFTPHSPLLLPSINKTQMDKVEKTTSAMQELADELYASHPDVIVHISEHPTIYPDAFSINLSDPYKFDLSSLGDLGITRTFRPDIMLIDRLQRSLRAESQPITLTTDYALHYASAVPLLLLTKELPNVQLVPISFSELPPKDHFHFGQALKDMIFASDKRIAVIASGDMSHALTSNAPADFHKDGQIYDDKIQEIIAQRNSAGLLSLSPEIVANAKETSYLPLAIFFGLLDKVSMTPQILSYEAPFGVGYLTVNFVLK
ncbi:MAG: AmmeMemoRadiSam system protein B [Candidatus Uhrbacteria bacterium]|nr:AmmeMemoRadiSam system protein B [Candidatus Uhrbacteria bacterium]